jgi:transposase
MAWQAPAMITTNRIDRQELQDRRLCAAELFAAGVRQAEVARQLDVTRQSVHRWYPRWREGGVQALCSRGPTGYPSRLSDTDVERLTQLLLQGAVSHGFTGELWTVARITQLIVREFGVVDHPSHVVAAASPAGLQPAAAGPPGQGTRPGHRRPVGHRAVAQDQGNA